MLIFSKRKVIYRIKKERSDMEKIKLIKGNRAVIPCLVEIPEDPAAIVIMVHGFTSNKSCATAELLFRRFPERGIGVITYDQPGHGEEEAKDDELRIENCEDSLARVEKYVEENYPGVDIFYFASSFGAYITSLFVSTRRHAGRKAFLRSAAVIMPILILGPPGTEPDPQVMAELDEKGFIEPDLGLGDRIRITRGFLEDLQENDLFQLFDNDSYGVYGETNFEMVHGGEDPVVPVDAACSFAKKFGFKITVMEGEGHSICTRPESPDEVADLALNFFTESLSK